MFKKGNYIVYRKDVCLVNDIVELRGEKYYSLSPLCDESMQLKIPVNNTTGLLREVISKENAEKLIDNIPNIEVLDLNEKTIENEYQKLLASSSVEDLIKIIKTTYLRNDNRLKNGKKIGEKDDLYFKKAEQLLYTEFSISLGMSYKEAKDYVHKRLLKIEAKKNDANK